MFFKVNEEGQLYVNGDHQNGIKQVILDYQHARDDNLLLQIPFVTLFDYLFYLRHICTSLYAVGKKSVFYSSAAVSDFYLPVNKMAEHKIQSSDGAPTIQLECVPKMISSIKSDWCPETFLVTFKLETDDSILQKKVGVHLNNYGANLVIGNILDKHKNQVYVCQKETPVVLIERDEEQKRNNVDIEMRLIEEVVSRHSQYLNQ